MSLMSPLIETKRNLRLSPFIEPAPVAGLCMRRRGLRAAPRSAELKKSAEKCRRCIRDAEYFVRRLTIEFEIELRLGAAVVPVGKKFQLASPEATLREPIASDGYAHARRLSGDTAFLSDRLSRSDDAACDETRPAFVLTREDEDRIARGDVLSTIHRLPCHKRECFRQLIANRSLDRERHFCPPLTNSRYSSQNAETFFRPDF